MAWSGVDRLGLARTTCCRRSRTTSDLEHLRPRDSASISATSGSGNRTVIVFILRMYYNAGSTARQIRDKTCGWQKSGANAGGQTSTFQLFCCVFQSEGQLFV
jgi:hypothetical protein